MFLPHNPIQAQKPLGHSLPRRIYTRQLDTAHLRDMLGDEGYESFARAGEHMTNAAMATYTLDQIDQAPRTEAVPAERLALIVRPGSRPRASCWYTSHKDAGISTQWR
jgi:hypothetical protein